MKQLFFTLIPIVMNIYCWIVIYRDAKDLTSLWK